MSNRELALDAQVGREVPEVAVEAGQRAAEEQSHERVLAFVQEGEENCHAQCEGDDNGDFGERADSCQ